MLQWLEDSYAVTAGDVALGYTGRFWNWSTHRWETISGVHPNRSTMTKYRLRAVSIYIYDAALAMKRGRMCELYVVGDPLATNRVVRLLGGFDLQGGNQHISWQGDFPMAAGFLYRVPKGGVIATDVISAFVGYE